MSFRTIHSFNCVILSLFERLVKCRERVRVHLRVCTRVCSAEEYRSHGGAGPCAVEWRFLSCNSELTRMVLRKRENDDWTAALSEIPASFQV